MFWLFAKPQLSLEQVPVRVTHIDRLPYINYSLNVFDEENGSLAEFAEIYPRES